MKILLPLALLALSPALRAAVPDLVATISYETVTVGNDGVEKTIRYREKLTRQGKHVWRERLNARAGGHDHDNGHGAEDGHDHIDYAAASRHVWLDAKGLPRLEFAVLQQRLLVQVGQREWGDVGFDGSWTLASQLVDIAKLKGFTVGPGADGSRWYRKTANGRSKQLQWSTRWALPLRVESRSQDGRHRESMRVDIHPLAAGQPLPWAQTGRLRGKDYMDTLD
ncbi:hypothetical protein [Chromobacterium haemolyticum]|uniref:hypothetical protein n=1 Tax=Chromobacterium haemolyticum TaxID=394935 RepID=UPI0009DA02C4|nr:hypothetical protein [Chromobacterium haemolyticum]OQS35624.1 hypothetical protein B0T40_12880 [Chromobacterium haemolyticum]QOD81151.1 hypothetical protein IEZ30_14525 [Chromobacterium haemolyticum]